MTRYGNRSAGRWRSPRAQHGGHHTDTHDDFTAPSITDFLLERIVQEMPPPPDYESDTWPAARRRRRLAECEAKRRIVDEHPRGPSGDCGVCSRYAEHPCPTLRALALPYADHPDYRDEWRP